MTFLPAQAVAGVEKEVPFAWVAAAGLVALVLWTLVRRLRGQGRLAPRGMWPVAGGVVVVFAFLAGRLTEQGVRKGREAALWPVATGKVEWTRFTPSAGLRFVGHETQMEKERRRRDSGDHFEIRYRYRVLDREYSGDQVTRGHLRVGNPDADWARRFPRGATVKVHYNPADPTEAVLEPNPVRDQDRKEPLRLVFVGLGFVGLGFVERFLHGNRGPTLFPGTAEA